MRFWLGTHMTNWLREEPNLFISRRRLQRQKALPEACGPWALDSGGFTELSTYGEWRMKEREYVALVCRYSEEIGNLEWVAPMDWMCEPMVLEETGRSIPDHQWLTLANFLILRDSLGSLVIPVLQGWEREDYLRHAQAYEEVGVHLADEAVVGLGSVCRRQDTDAAASIIRSLDGLRLHGFGIKTTGLDRYGDALHSADSMAWSYDARRAPPLPGHSHQNCSNCLEYARQWRSDLGSKVMRQGRLEAPP